MEIRDHETGVGHVFQPFNREQVTSDDLKLTNYLLFRFRFSDFFGGRIKRLLLFLFVCSSASFLWFSLLCLRIIPFSEG